MTTLRCHTTPDLPSTNGLRWLSAGVLMAGISSCSLPSEAQWKATASNGKSLSTSAAQGTATSTAAATSLESLAPQHHLAFQPCLEQALRHNLKAHIARLNTQAAAQNESIARAAFDPLLKLSGITYPSADSGAGAAGANAGNAMLSKKFITGTELRVEAGTAFANSTNRGLDYVPQGTEQVIRLTQPLLRGIGIAVNRAPIDLAKITTVSADALARAEVMEMLRATEAGYWTVVWAKQSLHVQTDSLARSRQILSDVGVKHGLGAATKIDKLEAEAAVAAATEQIERASQRYNDAFSNLVYLLGLVPGQMPEGMTFEKLNAPKAAAMAAESHYEQALRLNPLEVLLANEVERRSIESRVARNAMLPSVNLEISRGSSGLIGSSSSSAASGKGNDSANWSAFLQVSIPWTSRGERAQAEQARLQLERSEVAREDGRRELRREIFETVREIDSGHRQLDAANEGVRVNQAKWDEQMQRHKEGIVSVRDLREAEAELQQASLRALTAQLGVLVSDTRLARLDGSILQRHALTF